MRKNQAMNPDSPAIRGADGRFPKGVSGNPKGRPPTPQALVDAVPAACQYLIDVLSGAVPVDHTAERLQAARDILDRVIGKAPQAVEATVTSEVTPAMQALLDLARARSEEKKAT